MPWAPIRSLLVECPTPSTWTYPDHAGEYSGQVALIGKATGQGHLRRVGNVNVIVAPSSPNRRSTMTVELRRKRIDKTRSETWPEGRCSRAVVTDPAYDLGVGGDRNENFATP